MSVQYEEIYTHIEGVKQEKQESIKALMDLYARLIHKIVLKLRRTFRFMQYEEIKENVEVFFLQLVFEYDPKVNDNFTNYIVGKLYFRVKEFLIFDYEQTGLMHRNMENCSVEYCDENIYKNKGGDFFTHPNIVDIIDYLHSYLNAEELDMFVCYYVLCYTQDQMSTIFGMTQCPVNIKVAYIAGKIKEYFSER
jgi:DNA polymerase III epsilon subunit-like protein